MARRPARGRLVHRAAACLAIALVASACSARPAGGPAGAERLSPPDGPMPTLDATVWVQTSAGYAASALQTYRLARHELDRALADSSRTALLDPEQGYRSLPPAVVLDVDETVLRALVATRRCARRLGAGTEPVASGRTEPVPLINRDR